MKSRIGGATELKIDKLFLSVGGKKDYEH